MTRGHSFIAVGLALAVVVYFLSPPFVMMAALRLNLSPPWYHAIALFYQPAAWLAAYFPPYGKLIVFFLNHLGTLGPTFDPGLE